jgi:hypothetical protein
MSDQNVTSITLKLIADDTAAQQVVNRLRQDASRPVTIPLNATAQGAQGGSQMGAGGNRAAAAMPGAGTGRGAGAPNISPAPGMGSAIGSHRTAFGPGALGAPGAMPGTSTGRGNANYGFAPEYGGGQPGGWGGYGGGAGYSGFGLGGPPGPPNANPWALRRSYGADPQTAGDIYRSSWLAIAEGGGDPEAWTDSVTQAYYDEPTGRTYRRQKLGPSGRPMTQRIRPWGPLGKQITAPVYEDVPEMARRYYPERQRAYDEMGTRALQRYGDSAQAEAFMAQVAGPITASAPSTGMNWADLLARYGPGATAAYASFSVPFGQPPPVTARQMYETSASLRRDDRAAAFSSTLTRGSGAALFEVYQDQARRIAGLPGGVDSLAYAQNRMDQRSAMMQAYDQMNTVNYEIPMLTLTAMRAKAGYLPYGNGNLRTADVLSIAMNQKQMGVLRGQMGSMRAAGQLTEAGELDFTRRISALDVDIARSKSELSIGMENVLPGLSVNAIPNFSRWTSNELANARLFQRGSPIRDFGSISGMHAKAQQNWLDSFGAGDVSPQSRTSAINNPAIDTQGLVQALNRLTDALNSNASSGSGRGNGDTPSAANNKDQGRFQPAAAGRPRTGGVN